MVVTSENSKTFVIRLSIKSKYKLKTTLLNSIWGFKDRNGDLSIDWETCARKKINLI